MSEGREKILVRDLEMLGSELGGHTAQCFQAAIQQLKKFIDEYIEPFICPQCGKVTKVPYNDKNPEHCIHCENDNMLTYSYLEVKRMDAQIKHLLYCANHYSKEPNNEVALATLQSLPLVTKNMFAKPEKGA